MSAGQDGLPAGWGAATLPTLAGRDGVFIDGDWVESKDQDPDGDVRLIQLADIGDGYYRNRSGRFMTGEKAAKLRCTFLEPEDVLISRMPDPLGRACLFPGDSKPSVTVVDVAIFRAANRKAVDHRWVMNWINAHQFRKEIAGLSSGTTRTRISRGNLGTVEFPVPPTAEQKRIVAKIEALQARSDAAKEALDAIPPLLEKFRQSVLAAAFRGDLTKKWREAHPDAEPASELLKRIRAERRRKWQEANPKKQYVEPEPVDTEGLPELPAGWCWASLEELAEVVDPQPSHRTPPPDVEGVPYVGIGDVTESGLLDERSARRVSRAVLLEHRARYTLRPGDFMFGKIGTIGRPRRLPGPFNYALSANVILVQPQADTVAEDWLLWFLQSPTLERVVASLLAATTQAAFGIKKMRMLQVPFPSLAEQSAIILAIYQRLDLAAGAKQRTEAVASSLPTLNQSILAKAFRGELVPQDPTDEPASVLLERIRRERDGQGAPVAKRGRKPASRS
jgi:type I restriction enzyme S subunit